MSYPQNRYTEKNGVLVEPGQDEISEKSRLQQPVKLHPSWEENNLPEEELNFKNLSMDEATLQLYTPPDKYNLVYITFLIHGIGVLMPWNMFITAIDYFTEHKLAKDYIGYVYPHTSNFMQYLTFASQVPNILFSWMNIFIRIGGNLTTRIVWSISIAVIVFIITIILAMIETDENPDAFFWITICCVVVLNMANGIYQNTIFGMAAKLPGKYTGAVILGSNISGTFTAVVSLLSKVMTSNNPKMAAIYYFITALFVLLVCFDTYFALPLNRFYRHYELKEKKDTEKQQMQLKGMKERPAYLYILRKSYPQLINVFMVFFVTLAIFPALHADVKRVDEKSFFIPDEFYTSITCFITFNVFAMIGSILPSYIIWPSPRYLWIPVYARLLYIPFYLLCNYQPGNRIMPVLINNDWAYWIVAVTMALSSGYFSSLGMMYTPRTVEDRYAATAGMFAAAALVTGIFCGILVSFLWPWVVAHVGN